MSAPLPKAFKGKRPVFFDDPAVDALLSTVIELAQEVSVLRDRQAAFESFLDSQGVAARAAFASYQLPDSETADLAARRTAFIERLFRVLERPD
jgi:hypothetical protein